LGGTSYDGARSIVQTNDGGYITAGTGSSNDGNITGNHGGDDYWVVKMNSNGTIQWQKSLGGTFDDEAWSIIQTSDGGYMVAGYSRSIDGDVTGHHSGQDCWVVKLDGSGNIQWQKCLGGTSNEGAWAVIQTSDGGYMIAGGTISTDGDVTGNHGIADYWIVKLDGSGNIQWQKCLGGTGDDEAYSIIQTSDGGYTIAGASSSTDGDVTGNHGNYDCWIVKIDGSGNIQWQKSLGGTESDFARSVIQTSDGGYVVAGNDSSNNGDVTGNHGSYDCWIVKLNSSGNIQWQKSLGGTNHDGAFSIKQTSDGGYIAAGYSRSNDGDVTGNHGGGDFWVVKLSSNGNIEWQKSLGGTSDEGVSSIKPTSDGGYIVAGFSQSNDGDVTGNHGLFDYWIVKLAPYVGINELTEEENFVSPNSATNETRIESNKFKVQSIEIYNVTGQLQPSHFKPQTNSIDISELTPGIYFVTLKDETGNKVVRRVVKM
jgi:hypothetical protein